MATIQDVAKAANVSISTVSRVVNGKSNVSYDKRERVLDAIRQTGYTAPARVDSTPVPGIFSANGIILVVSNVIHKELFSSLQENAHEYGYETLFLLSGAGGLTSPAQSTFQFLVQSGQVCGIALINPLSNHKEMYDDPIFQKLPTVQIDSRVQGADLCYVGNDDYQAAFDLTSYLLKRYHSLVYLSAFTQNNPEGVVLSLGTDRQRGFMDAMRANGFREEEIRVLYSENTFNSGRKNALELIENGQLPEAFLCCSDYIALGVISAMEEKHIGVPADVGVACISGENEFPDILHPSLTRVRQSFDDIGQAAIRVLHELHMKDISSQRSVLINYQLVPGETTKA